ncbi:putative ankyrin repeat protein RF_0381 [Leptopilina heterotoma]|uniref:putative ankyrin repeat protein RF_0381 n=1 Tax=Leptopilina heterotoma TaxID=63436 RepID=UPI001CA97D93|nr:putative ankyrin repeat protein RF_0381 [Leptopilina heterotoma]
MSANTSRNSELLGSPVQKYQKELEDSLLSGLLNAVEIFMEEEERIPKDDEEDEKEDFMNSTKFKDLINFFLSVKKDFDILSPEYSTLLHFVVKHGDNESFVSLLKENLDVNSFNSKGTTLMHIVAMNGTCEMMQALLDRGANINTRTVSLHEESFEENNNLSNSEGYTPIHCAALAGNVKMLELLLKKGANVNVMSYYGTPLHFACGEINGNMENDYLLKKKSFSLNEKIILGEERTKTVEFLLKHGADSELIDSNKKTALQRACFNGKLRIISVLLNHIAPV